MDTLQQTKSRIDNHEIKSELDCLRTIVVNISENCQLHCPMCPRGNGYPNQEKYMNYFTACKLRERLFDIDFDGTVSISGMGEPTLNPSYKDIIKLLCSGGKYKVQLLTNGIKLSGDSIADIIGYGAKIIISAHDETPLKVIDNLNKWMKIYKNDEIVMRNHTLTNTQFKISNRAGSTKFFNSDSNNVENKCYYPFYKMVIDYDGSYLLCQDDWKRLTKTNACNLETMSISDYFIKYCNLWKQCMVTTGRQTNTKSFRELCAKCNTEGITMGGNMFEYFKKKYNC